MLQVGQKVKLSDRDISPYTYSRFSAYGVHRDKIYTVSKVFISTNVWFNQAPLIWLDGIMISKIDNLEGFNPGFFIRQKSIGFIID